MIPQDDKNELGLVKIHNDVIASTAYLATQEVDGISRICDNMASQFWAALKKKDPDGRHRGPDGQG